MFVKVHLLPELPYTDKTGKRVDLVRLASGQICVSAAVYDELLKLPEYDRSQMQFMPTKPL